MVLVELIRVEPLSLVGELAGSASFGASSTPFSLLVPAGTPLSSLCATSRPFFGAGLSCL